MDALFTKNRQAKQAKSTLTFTGLLNALDGVGSSLGQLFILTTNLREELDSALIRNGRVDMQVFFDYANDEQIVKMWNVFYPPTSSSSAAAVAGDGLDLATEFCRILRSKLEGKTIAPCALQHFFVSQRTKTAQEALANVDSLMEDLKQKEVEAAASTEKGKEGKGESEEKKGDDDDDSEDDGEKDAKGKEKDGSTVVHIHFHGVDGAPTTAAAATVTSTESGSPTISTTTAEVPPTPTTPTTTPAPPVSNTVNVMGANNRSITVTITTSSSTTPTVKDVAPIAITNCEKDDNKIVDKLGEGNTITEGEVVGTSQANDETKTV